MGFLQLLQTILKSSASQAAKDVAVKAISKEATKQAALEGAKQAAINAGTFDLLKNAGEGVLMDTLSSGGGGGGGGGVPGGFGGGNARPRPTGQIILADAAPRAKIELASKGAQGQRGRAPAPGFDLTARQSPSLLAPAHSDNPAQRLSAAADGQIAGSQFYSFDTSRMGPRNAIAAEQTAEARRQLGLPEAFTRANPEGMLMRAAKTLGRQVPILGELVPENVGASFKDLSFEDIFNNPVTRKRWDGLTQQQKVFALLDGSNKGAQLLGESPAVWERIMGASDTRVQDGLVTQRRVGGAGGHPGALKRTVMELMGGGGGVASTPAQGAGGGVIPQAGIQGGAIGTQEKEGREPAGAGAARPLSLAPGQTDFRVLGDVRPRNRYTVISDQLSGFDLGDTISASDLGAEGLINAGLIRPAVAKPDESKTYINRNTGIPVSLTNSEIASNPEKRAEHIEWDGSFATAVQKSDGAVVQIPTPLIALKPGEYEAETARGLYSVVKDGTPGFMTEEDIKRKYAFGDVSKRYDAKQDALAAEQRALARQINKEERIRATPQKQVDEMKANYFLGLARGEPQDPNVKNAIDEMSRLDPMKRWIAAQLSGADGDLPEADVSPKDRKRERDDNLAAFKLAKETKGWEVVKPDPNDRGEVDADRVGKLIVVDPDGNRRIWSRQ